MKVNLKVNKKVYSSILALSIGFGAFAVGGNVAHAEDKTDIQYDKQYNTPSYIIGNWKAPKGLSNHQIVQTYMQEKFNQPKGSFKIVEEKVDENTGTHHFKLQQLYNGIPVYGATQTVAVSDNDVTSYFGTVIPDLKKKSIHTNADASKNLMIERAKQAIEEDIGNVEEYDGKIEAEPFIYEHDGKFYNTYLVTASTTEPEVGFWHYFIDPANGKVVDHFNAAEEVTAFGVGVYGKKQKFEALKIGNKYALQDTTRGQGVMTFDASKDMGLVTSVSKMFGDGASVDAHANAQKTYDYYKKTFDRNSVDDKGQPLLSRVHVGEKWNNASWNGVYMSYGDGDGVRFNNLAGGLDVAAHEMSHGMVQHTANLIYRGEPGALNESYADIFGTMVERENWLMGEDIMADGTPALRSLEDPPSLIDKSYTKKPYPDHYSKLYTGNLDNGGVHVNSSINNKAAYLISEGGEHYGVKINGVGREAAEQIYYHAISNYMTSRADFSMMRQAAIQAAVDLYGENSAEYKAVVQAYNAVGVH